MNCCAQTKGQCKKLTFPTFCTQARAISGWIISAYLSYSGLCLPWICLIVSIKLYSVRNRKKFCPDVLRLGFVGNPALQ